MDMATLNTHVPGWAANTNSSLGWFGDNTKPAYRRYDLEGMAGYYYYHLNISDDGGFYAYACANTGGNFYNYVTVNCCQDSPGIGGNCACNCNSNCGTDYQGQCVNCANCLPPPQQCYVGNPQCTWISNGVIYGSGVNCTHIASYAAQCGQCYISGNCDSRAWMQPNCNCMQCNCACNCGQCGGQCAQCVNCNGNCASECTNCYLVACDCITCFLQGTPVLMADHTWKAVETIQPGELVWTVEGPYPVDHIEKPLLGPRRMFRFTDKSLIWSEEHPFWARRDDGQEWLWTAGPEVWRNEIRLGGMRGLKDNFSIWSGEGYEFAHIDGFVKRDVEEVKGYSPMTQLYAVITKGPMTVTAGYLVAAGTDEFTSDYSQIKWEEMRPHLS